MPDGSCPTGRPAEEPVAMATSSSAKPEDGVRRAPARRRPARNSSGPSPPNAPPSPSGRREQPVPDHLSPAGRSRVMAGGRVRRRLLLAWAPRPLRPCPLDRVLEDQDRQDSLAGQGRYPGARGRRVEGRPRLGSRCPGRPNHDVPPQRRARPRAEYVQRRRSHLLAWVHPPVSAPPAPGLAWRPGRGARPSRHSAAALPARRPCQQPESRRPRPRARPPPRARGRSGEPCPGAARPANQSASHLRRRRRRVAAGVRAGCRAEQELGHQLEDAQFRVLELEEELEAVRQAFAQVAQARAAAEDDGDMAAADTSPRPPSQRR